MAMGLSMFCYWYFLGVPKERNGPDNEDGHLLDGGPLRTQEDDQDAR